MNPSAAGVVIRTEVKLGSVEATVPTGPLAADNKRSDGAVHVTTPAPVAFVTVSGGIASAERNGSEIAGAGTVDVDALERLHWHIDRHLNGESSAARQHTKTNASYHI
jgi:hypothetical protein